MSPGGSVSRALGLTPLVVELAALEAAVGALEEALAVAGAAGAVVDDDDEPQAAAVRASATASATRVGKDCIEPPSCRGVIAGDGRHAMSRGGLRQVNGRSKLDRGATVGPMTDPAILVIEDDEAIAAGLVRVLEGQGYDVRRLGRGTGAVRAAAPPIELVILDLGLPDADGLDVCRRVRAARPDVAILILTARDHELDIVAGLDAGADDYLVKPFRLSELLARIRSRLRRAGEREVGAEPPLEAGGVRVDRVSRRVWLGEEEISLRPKEFELLAMFVSNPGVALTRSRIMETVWETSWAGSTKTLDTHVLTLRHKLGSDAIVTLRGVGYRFDAK